MIWNSVTSAHCLATRHHCDCIAPNLWNASTRSTIRAHLNQNHHIVLSTNASHTIFWLATAIQQQQQRRCLLSDYFALRHTHSHTLCVIIVHSSSVFSPFIHTAQHTRDAMPHALLWWERMKRPTLTFGQNHRICSTMYVCVDCREVHMSRRWVFTQINNGNNGMDRCID